MPEIDSPRILVLDDEAPQMKALCAALGQSGYATTGFTSANTALEALRSQYFDLALTDMMMPELDGISFLRAARRLDPDLAGILMTGQGTIDTAVQAMRAGAHDFILKPFRLSAILPVVSRALEARRLSLENIQLQQTAAIYELSMSIRKAPDFTTALQRIANAMAGQPLVDGVAILLPADDRRALSVAVKRGSSAVPEEGSLIAGDDALSRAFGGGQPGSVPVGDPISGHVPDFGGVSLPMLTGGRLIGMMNLSWKSPDRPVAPGQLKALNILAGAAAAALDSASLLEQLRLAEQRYRTLSESAPDIIFRYELLPRFRVVYMNPAVTGILGYTPEEFYARPDLLLDAVVHPEDREILQSLLDDSGDTAELVALRYIHQNGEVVWIEQHNVPIHDAAGRLTAMEGIARNVTERKLLEDELLQAQKMESVGLLAGGIAHDFNNQLAVILGFSEMIQSDDDPSPVISAKIGQVIKAANHAAVLTRQLLSFSRQETAQPTTLNLNKVVVSASKILRRLIGEDIQLVTNLSRDLRMVRADGGQIEQILMNLAVNAKAAMPRGGRITIETVNGSGTSEGSVLLSVSDTGCGIAPAIQARIFDPFYTTKPEGQGTGLGLSIVQGIVKRNLGEIRVVSEPGKGARFEVTLPCAAVEIEEIRQPVPEPSLRERQSGAILLVEDEEPVRRLIATVLEKEGYEVLRAADGIEAMRICTQYQGKLRLILTDLVMPGISGPQLVELVGRLVGDVKVLFMSGYPGGAWSGDPELNPETPYIQKPFAGEALISRIREILASDGGPGHHASAP